MPIMADLSSNTTQAFRDAKKEHLLLTTGYRREVKIYNRPICVVYYELVLPDLQNHAL